VSQSSKERERDDALVATVHSLSRWFVENRTIAWALLVMTVLGGVFGYMRMPKAKDPYVEVRVTLAICPWPGAGVDRIEELVTRRIERAVAENPNLEKIESTTLENLSMVFITLSENAKNRPRELDDLEGRLDAIKDLPQGAGPIKFLKDFGDTTTLMLTVASPPAGEVELELRARAIQHAIEAVRGTGGTGRAAVIAGYPPAIDARLARNAAQLVWRGLIEAGLARDERLIEGPSFIGVDFETRATDETLASAIEAFVRERLRGSELHPDLWRPAIIRAPEDTLARITAAAGDRYSYRELDDFTDTIQRAMQTLPIVAKVTRSGVLEERVFLEYSQERLASYGFRQSNIAEVLGARNITFPGGEVEVGDKVVRIDPSGEFASEAAIGDVMVPVAGSHAAYLRDLVDVVRAYDGPPRYLNYLTARGADGVLRRSRAISLAIDMRKNDQIEEFARQVDAKLAELGRVLPSDLILRRTSDQPLQVRENVHLFMNSLYEAIVLIVIVALIGFWDWRGAAIMALSIPITLAMTFAGMYALGVDVQQISIASLIIALGLLVDNPVVAGDAIKRALGGGHAPVAAAWLGPTKLAVAILFATITNIAAYLPFLTVSGDTGIFIRTLPIVMTISLVASLIVAKTFIPLLGYYLLRPAGREPTAIERRTQGFGGRYARVVAYAIEHRKAVFAASLVVLAGWFAIASRLKPAFFPHDLQYLSVVDVWLPEDAPLSITREKTFEADAIVREVAGPALDSVTMFIGGGGPRFWFSVEPKMQQLNYAQLVVQLKDKEATSHFARRLQPELSKRIAGVRIDVKELETAKPIDWPVAVRLAGENPEVLRDLAARLEADLRALPEAERVRDDWGYPAFGVKLAVDPDRANMAGVTNLDVAVSSALAMNGIQVSQLRDGRRMIPIVARLRASERSTLSDVQDLYVHSDVTGQTVPLRQVSRLEHGLETQKIRRRDHHRAITVCCYPTPPCLPSETLAAAQPAIDRLKAAMPPGYTLTIAGEFEEQQKGFADLAIALLLSVAGIYLSLVFQFKSVMKPLVVFAAIVYGAAAALVALVIMGAPFGFMAFLGTISLIGVIVSHVIVLFDFIEEAHHMGEPLHEALVDAGIVRLRPVMITVAATVLGLFPLAMHGGPLWEPLCYAQIGGLTVATFLTLLLVPVIYTIFVEDLGWIRWEKPAHADAEAHVETHVEAYADADADTDAYAHAQVRP
jgi:multidrug efflux pump subunit AcrB